MRSDRLATRFYLVGAALAILLTIVCVALLTAVRSLQDASDEVTASETRLFTASRAQRLTVDLETGLRGFFLTSRESFLDPTRNAQRELPAILRSLAEQAATEPAQAAAVARVGADLRVYLAFVAAQVAAGPDRPRPQLEAIVTRGKRQLDALRGRYERFIAAERAQAQRLNDEANARGSRAAVIGGIGFLLLLAAIPFSLLYLMRVVVRPVRDVAGAAEQLAAGDPGARAPEAGAGEVGQLARSFNAMADALEVSRTELEQRGIRLAETNRRLREAFAELVRSKQQAILELSTPVLQLASGVLVLPIIGALDAERARQIDDRLLAEVRRRRARVVVVDVTGVPEIDSTVAAQLLATVTAVRLLGARVITTGVSGELAAALVALDVDFTVVESYADLQRGVESATRRG